MSNSNNGHSLVRLIGALSKSEKRYFKLYSQRNRTQKSDLQFVKLFDLIDKKNNLSEAELHRFLIKKLEYFSSKKLLDLKRHLYWQVLESLRLYNAKSHHFELPAKVEMARSLYRKGLFLDSLEILKKAKKEALIQQKFIVAYEIIDFEKDIESRHVTRSHSTRAIELENQTDNIRANIKSKGEWSSFALKLYAKFLQIGHVKNEIDFISIEKYFNNNKPKGIVSGFYFFDSLYHAQSHLWFNYITLDFVACFKFSLSWIQLFEKFPDFKEHYPHLHIKGLHNLLSVLFNCLDQKRHKRYLVQLEGMIDLNRNKYDQNTLQMSFIYLNTARLNAIILSGKFSESTTFLQAFEEKLKSMSDNIDEHRLMVFWYKMGSIYFTMGDHRNCIRLLNNIINPDQKKLREDIQCFARLLKLIAHFEQGDNEYLSYSIISTYRFLIKMNDTTELHQTIINFLRNALHKDNKSMKKSFIKLKEKLDVLNEKKYEQRSFLYLDIVSWLESKINSQPVESVIARKRLN